MISYRYQFVRLATVRKDPPSKKKTKNKIQQEQINQNA